MEKHGKWKQLPRRHKVMIESFLRWALIDGQALYWLFLKYETEILGEECWRMCWALPSPQPFVKPFSGGLVFLRRITPLPA
jgi:hypothetical protein